MSKLSRVATYPRRVLEQLRESNRISRKLLEEVSQLTRAVEGQPTSQELERLITTVKRQQATLTAMKEQSAELKSIADQQRKIMNVLRLEATADTIAELEKFAAQRQYDMVETMRRLADEEVSFARFGDGELKMMFDHTSHPVFQRNSPEIREALLKLFVQPSEPGLMIGWPHIFRGTNGTVLWSTVWRDVRDIVPDGVMYGDSHVSRPLFFQDLRERGVAMWRRVWDRRNICIVTGEGSRFELVPALFDNVAAHRFLYSTPRHAFDDLDRVIDQVSSGPRADLYLISLGPAGTILAARLAEAGYRAIDIGHISDSYLHVFSGEAWPENKAPIRMTERPAGA
jgi:hypothetical protein